jgi:carbon storage regulator
MLVLSRQRDETIMIGDEVELTVVDIRGDKVRIGIKAPNHVAVHRKEVYDAIRNENQQAAGFRGEIAALRPRGIVARPGRPNDGGTVLPAATRLASTAGIRSGVRSDPHGTVRRDIA